MVFRQRGITFARSNRQKSVVVVAGRFFALLGAEKHLPQLTFGDLPTDVQCVIVEKPPRLKLHMIG